MIWIGRPPEIMAPWIIKKEGLKIIMNKNAPDDFSLAANTNALVTRTSVKVDKDDDNPANALISRRRVFGRYAVLGSQRAEVLAFKQIKKVRFTTEMCEFVYNLKQLQHDNLTKLYGVSANDSKNFTFLYTLVERGTLEEFCLDHEFNMDETFKSAFMRDILSGLKYIHNTQIKMHGLLTAATCLIDVNWVLKLSLCGVCNFVRDLWDGGYIETDAQLTIKINFQQYACLAPEHLKEYEDEMFDGDKILRGSPKGDFYSVGMIFYMMIQRTGIFPIPSGSGVVKESSVLRQVINENLMPVISDKSGDEMPLLEVCKQCWNRDPEKRPGFRALEDAISSVYPFAQGNLVDQLIRINERQADALEDIVAAKTVDLMGAQERTMRLLNEMLPASIAKDLRNGIIKPPRGYESATVMFVQICDFMTIMKRSQPQEVILFLNDIFDQFDAVLKQHDAYKVETTGETYMVASGVPHENGGRHIIEVAEISLKIRELSYGYKLAHLKEYKLRIRIGFHAGPIAAGVIGIRAPRYCLFGDTVNFASRMQSNCPPNQIQTSEITARLLIPTNEYKLVKRGIVHVKGKGEVNCYWLNEHIHEDRLHHS
ncbi:unnamed protein product [Caenorhabditis sp. 36 PRJEB53466]|nr:unnamed protein product [Caenorhabditis sp. 36 PRJEB53466]